MKTAKKYLVMLLCMALMCLSLCACGSEKEKDPYAGLIFGDHDFLNCDMGDSKGAVEAAQGEPSQKISAQDWDKLSGYQLNSVDKATALLMNIEAYLYEGVSVGENKVTLIFFFVKDKLAFAGIQFVDAESPLSLYTQLKNYYDDKLGVTPITENYITMYVGMEGKGNKWVILGYDIKSDATALVLSDVDVLGGK